MADKADLSNTPIPRGCGRVPEVAAAGGGRTVVGNEIATGVRKALWQDNETGAWHDFPDPPGVGLFRLPAADAIFETSLWHRLRPRGGTYMNPDWPKPQFEDVRVVVSILATDKPLVPASPPPGGAEAAPSGEPTKAAAPLPPDDVPAPEPAPAVQEPSAAMPDYIPPFVALMLEAVKEFNITAANPSPGNKEDMTAYFTGKVVENWEISESMAKWMASLIRAPEAMLGGRKGSKKGGDKR